MMIMTKKILGCLGGGMQTPVFWVALSCLVGGYQRFGDTCYLSL
jgi:hypothetical protein